MKMNVKVIGIDKVTKKIDGLTGQFALNNVDKITETYTRKMANESAGIAPIESGDLRASITASPRRLKLGTWEYGSELAYARRQEYEHKSRKGFIRKSVWNNREPYREALRKELSRW